MKSIKWPMCITARSKAATPRDSKGDDKPSEAEEASSAKEQFLRRNSKEFITVEIVKKKQTEIIGIELEPLKEKLGVLVTNLNPKGLAKAAGVVPGDVLLRVDDTPCTNPDDTAMILRGKSGRFELHLRRGASTSEGSRFGLNTSLHAMVADL